MLIGVNLTTVIDDVCSGSVKSEIPQIKELATEFRKFESDIANWTSTYMCTITCPCETSVLPSRWEEARLNKYNRTNKVVNSNYTDPTTKKVYMGFQISADNYGA